MKNKESGYDKMRNAQYEAWYNSQPKCKCKTPEPTFTNKGYCRKCNNMIPDEKRTDLPNPPKQK